MSLEELARSRQPLTVGSDECGYGSISGPLVVAAVAVPRTWQDPQVRDSKKAKKVPGLLARIHARFAEAVFYRYVVIPARFIERMGPRGALMWGHRFVLETVLAHNPDSIVVVDGNADPWSGHKRPKAKVLLIPKADATVPAVMLASCLGKHEHDLRMQGLHQVYPNYGFDSHVGYDTEMHRAALLKYGPCPAHRRNYSPIKEMLHDPVPHP